jgi:hypothetical protein
MRNRILLVVGLAISLGCGGLVGGDDDDATGAQGVAELNAALDELDASLKLAEAGGGQTVPAQTLDAATERLDQAKLALEPAIQQATK